MALLSKTLRKQALLDMSLGVLTIRNHPKSPAFMRVAVVLQGRLINRLTYAVDNLTNVSTNTNSSRSRILDADYAKATTDLAKSQIIAQAANAMLVQANQNPQSVLQLLQR